MSFVFFVLATTFFSVLLLGAIDFQSTWSILLHTFQKLLGKMGKPKNGKKNYNKGKGKFKNDIYRKKKKFNKNSEKNKYMTVKKNIERNKESEEVLKRNQLGEYRKTYLQFLTN